MNSNLIYLPTKNMTEEELKVIQKYYSKLKRDTQKEESLQQSHSIEEASQMHELKKDIEQNVREVYTNKK